MSISADPIVVAALVVFTAFLMARAGLGLKGLKPRVTFCPVCHHPRTHCTCRWL